MPTAQDMIAGEFTPTQLALLEDFKKMSCKVTDVEHDSNLDLFLKARTEQLKAISDAMGIKSEESRQRKIEDLNKMLTKEIDEPWEKPQPSDVEEITKHLKNLGKL